MYFSIVPNISYDEKPISYPFSESDFVTAKNFFRRYKINEDVFSNVVYFQKYSITEGLRPDQLADTVYGNPFYDWVVLLVNNMVNAQYDWPLNNYEIYKVLESEYDDPYGTIHHYETYEIAQYPAGLHVDAQFYNSTHKINVPRVEFTCTVLENVAAEAKVDAALTVKVSALLSPRMELPLTVRPSRVVMPVKTA